jgi:hypothetical protein
MEKNLGRPRHLHHIRRRLDCFSHLLGLWTFMARMGLQLLVLDQRLFFHFNTFKKYSISQKVVPLYIYITKIASFNRDPNSGPELTARYSCVAQFRIRVGGLFLRPTALPTLAWSWLASANGPVPHPCYQRRKEHSLITPSETHCELWKFEGTLNYKSLKAHCSESLKVGMFVDNTFRGTLRITKV